MPYLPLSLSSDELYGLLEDKARGIALCNSQRESLPAAPAQSGFRVYAIILFTTPDLPGIQAVEGTNTEPLFIGGSICAERAAICKLRFFTSPQIHVVFITSDSSVPIAPGLLCREYLVSVCMPTWSPLPCVVLGDRRGDKITSWEIESLYPHSCLYRGVGRADLLAYGEAFVARTKLPIWRDAGMRNVYDAALAQTHRDGNQLLHPLSLSAAVLFADGSISVAWQLKGLEYGCSLDPVSQLINTMIASVHPPCFLVMLDQFGIAHAPFAQARALLLEHGFSVAPLILVHARDGACLAVTADSLAPNPPGDAGTVDAHMISSNSCSAR